MPKLRQSDWTPGWERMNVTPFHLRYCHPNCEFHSYVRTLKLTALAVPLSSPYRTYECTNNSPFIPQRLLETGVFVYSYVSKLRLTGIHHHRLVRGAAFPGI